MAETPQVFISYSHDSDAHKLWVLELAKFLQSNGVETILDQWDVKIGDDLPRFMEKGLGVTQKIVIVCTDNYVRKANEGEGGVGYEKRILTAKILGSRNQAKVIPVIRDATEERVPKFVGAALYLDLSKEKDSEESRFDLLKTIFEVSDKPPLGKNPFLNAEIRVGGEVIIPEVPERFPSFGNRQTTEFFDERFRQAFPGTREVRWFESPDQIQSRLKILLADPIKFSDAAPIWWWRDGNMSIDEFRLLDDGTFLLNVEELDISKIAAVPGRSYYQHFVYVEMRPMKSTGLYPPRDKSAKRYFSYDREEFGLVDGKTFVKREEYDDGAAEIGGNVVDITGRVELRLRYTTPFNFLIASNGSPINNTDFDDTLEKYLDGILTGEVKLEELSAQVLRLPKRQGQV